MCWIHKWRYDINFEWAERARTCIKCYEHYVFDWTTNANYRWCLVECDEYKEYIEDYKKKKIKEKNNSVMERNRLQPKRNCKYGIL